MHPIYDKVTIFTFHEQHRNAYCNLVMDANAGIVQPTSSQKYENTKIQKKLKYKKIKKYKKIQKYKNEKDDV